MIFIQITQQKPQAGASYQQDQQREHTYVWDDHAVKDWNMAGWYEGLNGCVSYELGGKEGGESGLFLL